MIISFDAATLEELRKKIAEFLEASYGQKVTKPQEFADDSKKKPSTKRVKAPEKAAPVVPEVESTEELFEEKKVVTPELVKEVLSKVTSREDGMKTGIALLKKFNASKFSDLAPGNYQAFIDECNLVLSNA